jgi:hypothetical protein
MQTFVIDPDPVRTARVLDRQRLGKQRVEAIQIARNLLGLTEKRGWSHHPAVRMWSGYEPYLIRRYLRAMLDEWTRRGYDNTKSEEHYQQLCNHPVVFTQSDDVPPPWLADERTIRSHRSNLVRKKPEHYRQFFPVVPANLEYFWPV